MVTTGVDISSIWSEAMRSASEAWTVTYWLATTEMNYHFSHSWTPESEYGGQCLHLAIWAGYEPAKTGAPTAWVRAGHTEPNYAERLMGFCVPMGTDPISG